jgi:hypothetical protein
VTLGSLNAGAWAVGVLDRKESRARHSTVADAPHLIDVCQRLAAAVANDEARAVIFGLPGGRKRRSGMAFEALSPMFAKTETARHIGASRGGRYC